jgi:hypothetical protein
MGAHNGVAAFSIISKFVWASLVTVVVMYVMERPVIGPYYRHI